MRLIVDEIEGSIASCEREDGSFEKIPLSALPAGVKAGSVLQREGNTYRIDADQQRARTQEGRSRLSGLLKEKK